VRFVDIGPVVDHHCLNFDFTMADKILDRKVNIEKNEPYKENQE
jgi:hypothetical protein